MHKKDWQHPRKAHARKKKMRIKILELMKIPPPPQKTTTVQKKTEHLQT